MFCVVTSCIFVPLCPETCLEDLIVNIDWSKYLHCCSHIFYFKVMFIVFMFLTFYCCLSIVYFCSWLLKYFAFSFFLNMFIVCTSTQRKIPSYVAINLILILIYFIMYACILISAIPKGSRPLITFWFYIH